MSDILTRCGIENQLLRDELSLQDKETGNNGLSYYLVHSIRVGHLEFDVFGAVGGDAVIDGFMKRYEIEDAAVIDKTREVGPVESGLGDLERFKSLFEKMRIILQHGELQKSTQPTSKHSALRRM